MNRILSARWMATIMIALGPSVLATGSPAARQEKRTDKEVSSLTGTWTMTVLSQQGSIPAGLVLKQAGKKVTGTLSSPHGDLPIEGEFVNGTLTLTVTIDDPDHGGQFAFKGTRKGGDSLAGTATSPIGDMTWTAERGK